MADLTTSPFTRTYTSFSGCDIVATFDNIRIGEIQGISYSITREKAPVYTMGSADPRSFSRGKRGIAGSMVFTMFDRHALHQIMEQSSYVAKSDENILRVRSGLTAQSVDRVDQSVIARLSRPVYADQIPPFDITLTGANEYGQITSMTIFGAEILNEGSGISVDDIVNELAVTFVARYVQSWAPYSASNQDIDILALGGSVDLRLIPELVETNRP
jgi:hypothetical protein